MALIHLHADDNVAIASRDLAMGERIRIEQGDVIVQGNGNHAPPQTSIPRSGSQTVGC
jgi:hypothetical protein